MTAGGYANCGLYKPPYLAIPLADGSIVADFHSGTGFLRSTAVRRGRAHGLPEDIIPRRKWLRWDRQLFRQPRRHQPHPFARPESVDPLGDPRALRSLDADLRRIVGPHRQIPARWDRGQRVHTTTAADCNHTDIGARLGHSSSDPLACRQRIGPPRRRRRIARGSWHHRALCDHHPGCARDSAERRHRPYLAQRPRWRDRSRTWVRASEYCEQFFQRPHPVARAPS